MNLVERHIINQNHELFSSCDDLCFKSKNIYNLSLYKINQDIKNNSYNSLNNLFHVMKNEDCFKQLPMKVATATTILVQKNIKSFFKGISDCKKHPEKYKSQPKFPKYLSKENGRFVTSYNYQAISKKVFKHNHKIKLSGINIEFYTKIESFDLINCVRIIPQLGQYTIEVCYSIPDSVKLKNNKQYLSIDLGVNNLSTLTSNIKGFTPLIINGKPLKSINQYYNKQLSYYKSKLEKLNNKKFSKRINKLTNKRTNKIDNYLHKSSNEIIKISKENQLNTIIIGKNDNWKQKVEMTKVNNQNFVNIPHSRFINMLIYKCEKEGVNVILQEESYTSKASFLNLDSIPTYGKVSDEPVFSGYRKHRGLYKIKEHDVFINADVNGSYNILRKAIPNAFVNGIEGVVVHPKIIKILN